MRSKRRAAQIAFMAVVALLPVFDILRYDVSTRELYLLGGVWELGLKEGFYLDHSAGGAAHVAARFFLKAVIPWLIVLSIFPLLGALLGRFFCGWLCPEGAFFEYADYLTEKVLGRKSLFGNTPEAERPPMRRRIAYGAAAAASVAVIPPLAALFLMGYFIAPETLWQRAAALEFTPGMKAGVAGVYAYMLTTFVLVRHTFCKYVCAAGLMQTLFGWASPVSLRIRLDRAGFSRCNDCRRCEKVCFMNVRPRSSLRDINCVNCGECVSACRDELGGDGLFAFGFGAGEAVRREPQALAHPALKPRCQGEK